MKDYFFESQTWNNLRYQILKRDGFKCLCCGADGKQVQLHVDHIKPRSKYPDLELDESNLQTLCYSCNMGKGNKHEDSFKEEEEEEDILETEQYLMCLLEDRWREEFGSIFKFEYLLGYIKKEKLDENTETYVNHFYYLLQDRYFDYKWEQFKKEYNISINMEFYDEDGDYSIKTTIPIKLILISHISHLKNNAFYFKISVALPIRLGYSSYVANERKRTNDNRKFT